MNEFEHLPVEGVGVGSFRSREARKEEGLGWGG